MKKVILSIFIIFPAAFLSETSAQLTFLIEEDTLTIAQSFSLDHDPPFDGQLTIPITNQTSEDIELMVDVVELRSTHPSEISMSLWLGSGLWNLDNSSETIPIPANQIDLLFFSVFLESVDCIPKDFYLELAIYDVINPSLIKTLVFRGNLGDTTPAAGFSSEHSNSSASFTPNINDWENDIEINNNGNGFQTYSLTNPNDSEIKIGYEIESFTYPLEWEITSLLSITGPSGHRPLNIDFDKSGVFWAWVNGTYTFDNFMARIKHHRVPGSAVLRINVHDVNDSLNYNEHFELSYHVCHPEVMREYVVLDRSQVLLCPGEALAISADPQYSDILWSTGQTGESITTMAEGNLTLTAKNEKGCSVVDTLELSVIRPYVEDICYIDVDPLTFNNTIYWYATDDVHTEKYKLYKQTEQAGLYEEVFEESINGFHSFIDTESDARVGSERYQISTVDVCGNESEGSVGHKTLHLTSNRGINGEINLIWEKYEGLEYSTFRILKGSSIDNMFLIAERPANTFTFTDLNPNQEDNFYRIEIDVEVYCDDIQASPGSPGSNIIHYQLSSRVSDDKNVNVVLSPNPVNSFLKLTDVEGFNRFIIYSSLGEKVKQGKLGGATKLIEIDNLQPGAYFLRLHGKSDTYRTFVKQ